MNFDVLGLTGDGAEQSVRNVRMEEAGFAWRELGTFIKHPRWPKKLAICVSTRPPQAVTREDFAQLRTLPYATTTKD